MDVHRSPAWLGGSGLRSGTEPHGVRELPACVLHLGCAVPLGGAAGAVDREAETARAAAAAGVRHLRTGGGLSPSSRLRGELIYTVRATAPSFGGSRFWKRRRDPCKSFHLQR